MTGNVYATGYIRPRMRRPKDEKELECLNLTVTNIGLGIQVWSKKNQIKGVSPLTRKGAERVARELLAAVNHARIRGPTANKVWDAYVDLYDALTRAKAAVGCVAGLLPQYQFLQSELGELERAFDAILGTVELSDIEKARFVKSHQEFVFDGIRRGRPIAVQGEIVRAAALVWRGNFDRVPPARKGSGFDIAVEEACKYFHVGAPGRIILQKTIREIGRDMDPSKSKITMRFSRNN